MRKSLYDYCRETGETALLDEWARDENGFGPEDVSYGSKKKCWWRCAGGHLYQGQHYQPHERAHGLPVLFRQSAGAGRERPGDALSALGRRVGTRRRNGAFTPRDVPAWQPPLCLVEMLQGPQLAGRPVQIAGGRDWLPGLRRTRAQPRRGTTSPLQVPRLAAEWGHGEERRAHTARRFPLVGAQGVVAVFHGGTSG